MLKQIIGTCTGAFHAWAYVSGWGCISVKPKDRGPRELLAGGTVLFHFQRVVMTFRPHRAPHIDLLSRSSLVRSCPSAELCLLTGLEAGAVPLGMAFSRFLCEAEHVPAAKITSVYTLWKQQQRHICLVWAEPACN